MSHLVSPDECEHCRALHAVLVDRHTAGSGRITTAALGAEVGLRERAVFVHLAVLVETGRLDLDRRTPLAPVGVKRKLSHSPSPQAWARSVDVPDRTCGRCLSVLAALAGPDWAGQAGQEELAAAGRMSVRTWRTHLAHLIEAGLVRQEADAYRTEDGQLRRRADRYVLLSGLLNPAPDLELVGKSWLEDRAHQLLAALPWFTGRTVSDADRLTAVRRVCGHLRDGWTEEALLHRLRSRPQTGIANPLGYLLALLPQRGEPYVIPAHNAVTGAALTRPHCGGCGVPFARTTAPPGSLCRDCRADRALSLTTTARTAGAR